MVTVPVVAKDTATVGSAPSEIVAGQTAEPASADPGVIVASVEASSNGMPTEAIADGTPSVNAAVAAVEAAPEISAAMPSDEQPASDPGVVDTTGADAMGAQGVSAGTAPKVEVEPEYEDVWRPRRRVFDYPVGIPGTYSFPAVGLKPTLA